MLSVIVSQVVEKSTAKHYKFYKHTVSNCLHQLN